MTLRRILATILARLTPCDTPTTSEETTTP
jgi:hypothetical protein